MPNVCILCDSTAQFSRLKYPGQERVHVIPLGLQAGPHPADRSLGIAFNTPRLIPPPSTEFSRTYSQLSETYDTIFVLTLSCLLIPAASQAAMAAEQSNPRARVIVVDSQTIGLGLGLLVQEAAAMAEAGLSPGKIEQQMRTSMQHIYTLFCIPQLAYLAYSGLMEYSQALVGEMMGLLPIYTLEDGQLTPIEKVRTQRHLFESFQEFISEFDSPAQVALMRSEGQGSTRSQPIRQFVQEEFPQTQFSEHGLSPHLAAFIGPKSTGLVILEKSEQSDR